MLKHRAPLAREGVHLLPAKNKFYHGFLLMWCNFKFEGVLFRIDSRQYDRVDSVWGCAGPSKEGSHNLTSTGSHLS